MGARTSVWDVFDKKKKIKLTFYNRMVLLYIEHITYRSQFDLNLTLWEKGAFHIIHVLWDVLAFK